MRLDRWDALFTRLIRTMGPTKGKARFREIWTEIGERLIERFEKDAPLREEVARVLDRVR